MWQGTVRSLPLREQLKAAALAGCEALSVTPFGYSRWRADGLGARDIRVMADEAGIQLFHLDPFIRWVDDWRPDASHIAFPYEALDFNEEQFFGFAEALEVESFSAWAAFPPERFSINEIIDAFGGLCERAAQRGFRCALEFLPMYGLPDLATAWRVVEAVDASNSGIVFDIWHYSRGTPDDALLRQIPGDRIAAVQLCDATTLPASGLSLSADGQTRRLFPGEGDFRIAEIVAILRDTGALRTVGLEIFSTELDALDVDAIGIACRDGLDSALAV